LVQKDAVEETALVTEGDKQEPEVVTLAKLGTKTTLRKEQTFTNLINIVNLLEIIVEIPLPAKPKPFGATLLRKARDGITATQSEEEQDVLLDEEVLDWAQKDAVEETALATEEDKQEPEVVTLAKLGTKTTHKREQTSTSQTNIENLFETTAEIQLLVKLKQSGVTLLRKERGGTTAM